jgi:CDP-diacylglycerol--glycerol-3-phosphate 3-phosphatidyltransferase
MLPEKSIRTSITLHGALFFVAQASLLTVVTLAYRMGWPRFALFLGISAAYHGLLTGLLVMRSADFRVESTGTQLPRVNLPNTLTLGRLSSLPSILYLIIQASTYSVVPVILPLMTIVFATDFLDGMIARRQKQITFVGRYLDSTSDYLMIVAVSIIFYYYDLVPLWFFILILCRLILFAAGMALLALRSGKTDPQATFLGKASIFALMVLYVMKVAGMIGVPWIGDDTVIRIVEYVVALIVVASLVDKAIFLRAKFAEAARIRKTPSARGSA